jgi:hypothetical protein
MHLANARPLEALSAVPPFPGADEPHATSPRLAPSTAATPPIDLREPIAEGVRSSW